MRESFSIDYFSQNRVIIIKIRRFNFFFKYEMFICLKSSDIEGNFGRSASFLVTVDTNYSHG